jgi:hypothetical protein
MNCPQCGTVLGAGAKACAACGWSAGRKTLWIVLGCIAGFFFLVCCGFGTWIFLSFRNIGTYAEEAFGRELPFIARVQVVNWAAAHGGRLPESLAQAAEEPIRGAGGKTIRMETGQHGAAQDIWGTALRYAPAADGTFEVRSAGPDRAFGGADDLVEKGSATEPLAPLKKELKTRFLKHMEEVMKRVPFLPAETRRQALEEVARDQGFDEPLETPAPPAPAEPAPAPGPEAPPAGGK